MARRQEVVGRLLATGFALFVLHGVPLEVEAFPSGILGKLGKLLRKVDDVPDSRAAKVFDDIAQTRPVPLVPAIDSSSVFISPSVQNLFPLLKSVRFDRRRVTLFSLVHPMGDGDIVENLGNIAAKHGSAFDSLAGAKELPGVFRRARGGTAIVVGHIEEGRFIVRNARSDVVYSVAVEELNALAIENDLNLVLLGCKSAERGGTTGYLQNVHSAYVFSQLDNALAAPDFFTFFGRLGSTDAPLIVDELAVSRLATSGTSHSAVRLTARFETKESAAALVGPKALVGDFATGPPSQVPWGLLFAGLFLAAGYIWFQNESNKLNGTPVRLRLTDADFAAADTRSNDEGRPRVTTDVRCSFCGKARADVRQLISNRGALICERCVSTCVEIIRTRVERDGKCCCICDAVLDGERAIRVDNTRLCRGCAQAVQDSLLRSMVVMNGEKS